MPKDEKKDDPCYARFPADLTQPVLHAERYLLDRLQAEGVQDAVPDLRAFRRTMLAMLDVVSETNAPEATPEFVAAYLAERAQLECFTTLETIRTRHRMSKRFADQHWNHMLEVVRKRNEKEAIYAAPHR